MKVALALATLLLGSQAFSSTTVHCVPASPCAEFESLGYCAYTIDLITAETPAVLKVIKGPQDPRLEIIMPPDLVPVEVSTFGRTLSFHNEDGDYHGEIKQGRKFQTVTLEEDFEFKVRCSASK